MGSDNDGRGGSWNRETDFASYAWLGPTEQYLQTTEARVAGTEFSIELPLQGSIVDDTSNTNELVGSIGFVLSGDGDDHDFMAEGEFHAFYPPGSSRDLPLDAIAGMPIATMDSGTTSSHTSSNGTAWWRQLPSHPGPSRWAPGSFVMRGTARVYFTSGYDRVTGILHDDVWRMDLSPLFRRVGDAAGDVGDTSGSSSNSQTASGAPVLFRSLVSIATLGIVWVLSNESQW